MTQSIKSRHQRRRYYDGMVPGLLIESKQALSNCIILLLSMSYGICKDDFITIDDLYPDLTPDQRQGAEQNLDAYIRIIRQIVELVFSDQAGAQGEASAIEEHQGQNVHVGRL
jgi:hypothetical protein